LEKSDIDAHRTEAVLQWLAENAETFRRQGFVVADWRGRGERRRGPFYCLRYREAGRQRSLYLGRDAELAAAVRRRLEELQAPLRREREDAREWAQQRATSRAFSKVWDRELKRIGLRLQGSEVRGWRRIASARRLAQSAIV
jgi:hypothetical protein